jgi:hypothetical protein
MVLTLLMAVSLGVANPGSEHPGQGATLVRHVELIDGSESVATQVYRKTSAAVVRINTTRTDHNFLSATTAKSSRD